MRGDKAFPTQNDVNSNGKVRVYDLIEGRYVFKHPVDVREGVALNVLAQFNPDSKPQVGDEDEASELIAVIEKANARQLIAIVKEEELDVDLDACEKLADKRSAVLAAYINDSNEDEDEDEDED